ncbi:hypothetical protein [Tissierella sp. Yu-01]|uniref:hypothetical protein n=1 Tax=Tissierella sp. Yu-01 TaxID=3035694 RepID=UPI00240D0CD9|nr:hypothetical protein [Tissierella sp. Yu-01]WFA10350.1 hypothetical protein P3962_07300 [Tissierella sp. Yu-01]
MIQKFKKKNLKLFRKTIKIKFRLANITDEESFEYLICQIKKEYIKKNIERITKGDHNYISREIMRLELDIERMEKRNYDSIFSNILFSSMITIAIFVFGNVLSEDIISMTIKSFIEIFIFLTVVLLLSEDLINRNYCKKIIFSKIYINVLEEIQNENTEKVRIII